MPRAIRLVIIADNVPNKASFQEFVVCVKPLESQGSVRLTFSAGGSSPLMSLLPTKLLMNWEDIGADHSDVPSFQFAALSRCYSKFPVKG